MTETTTPNPQAHTAQHELPYEQSLDEVWQDELARGEIRQLLDGGSPDESTPPRCGRWSDLLTTLHEAHAVGGTPGVREVLADLSNVNPCLARLLSEEADTDFLLAESADDEGNAQCAFRIYGRRLCFCDAYGWLHYNGRYWDREGAEADVERAIVDTLQRRREAAVRANRESIIRAAKPSAHNVRNCKFLLRSLVSVSVAEFDRSPDEINCANGAVDLRSGQLLPHTPDQHFTYCLPVNYEPLADFKEWEEFLGSVVGGGPEMIDYLQEAVGYTLTGHTREECLFYIVGPTRSGKGTFIEVILAVLGGRPLATQADFDTFTRKRDNDTNNADLATLKPCRFVAASESGRHQWLNASKIKQLTGGDDVYCALKYRDHFNYRPQYKLWLISNHAPKVDVDDDAAWNRIRLIEFPNSHAGQEDKLLKERLKRLEVQEQVLAWAVVGAQRWYQRAGQGLPTPQTVQRVTREARDRLDYVQQWLDEEVIELDHDAFLSNDELHQAYKEWCEQNGVTAKGIGSLSQALKSKGYRAGEVKKVQGKTRRGCYGIGLRQ